MSSVMLTTALDVITRAMRLIGVVGGGQSLQSGDAADALLTLNELIDGWSNDNLLIPATVIQDYDVDEGDETYTLGPAGTSTWTMPTSLLPFSSNPYKLERMSIVRNNRETGVHIATDAEWQRITDKTVRGIPQKARVYQRSSTSADAFNQTFITLWPVPSEDLTARIWVPGVLAEFSDFDGTYILPRGYARALRYCLAVDLGPEYEMPSAEIVMLANQYKADIQRKNLPMDVIYPDTPMAARGLGQYDINTDDFDG